MRINCSAGRGRSTSSDRNGNPPFFLFTRGQVRAVADDEESVRTRVELVRRSDTVGREHVWSCCRCHVCAYVRMMRPETGLRTLHLLLCATRAVWTVGPCVLILVCFTRNNTYQLTPANFVAKGTQHTRLARFRRRSGRRTMFSLQYRPLPSPQASYHFPLRVNVPMCLKTRWSR